MLRHRARTHRTDTVLLYGHLTSKPENPAGTMDGPCPPESRAKAFGRGGAMTATHSSFPGRNQALQNPGVPPALCVLLSKPARIRSYDRAPTRSPAAASEAVVVVCLDSAVPTTISSGATRCAACRRNFSVKSFRMLHRDDSLSCSSFRTCGE